MRILTCCGLIAILPISSLAGLHDNSVISTIHSLADVVPDRSVSVLLANWQEVRGNRQLRAIVRNETIETNFLALGIAPQDIDEVGIFESTAVKQSDFNGIIIRGSFDPGVVFEYLKRKNWNFVDNEISFVCADPKDNVCFSVLKSRMVVLGTRDGVRGVIEAENGLRAGLISHPLHGRSLRGMQRANRPVSMLLAFPQTWQDAGNAAIMLTNGVMNMGGLGPLGEILKTLGFARNVSFSFMPDGNGLLVDLYTMMRDEAGASLASGLLNLLKGATLLIPEQDSSPKEREALRNLRSMAIDRNGETLRIRFPMPAEALVP